MHDCPPSSRPITCREPQGNPPPIQVLESLNKASRAHHQQQSSINLFQQQKQHQSEEMFEHVKMHPSQQQSTSVYSDIPLSDMSSFDLNALSNQINAYNIISTPNVYATDGWPMPRTQQIIITPTIPLLNQAQSNAPINVGYNQSVSHDQMTGPRFGRYQNSQAGRRQRLFQPRNQFGRGAQRNFKKSLSSLNPNDLRQQLYLKRRLKSISNPINTLDSEDVINNESENCKFDLITLFIYPYFRLTYCTTLSNMMMILYIRSQVK